MRTTIFKEKKAFTIAELVISFTVLGLIFTIIMTSTILNVKKSKSEIIAGSQNFYNIISNTYLKVTSLSKNPVNAKTDNSATILRAMLKYMDYTNFNLDCTEVNFGSYSADSCAKLTSGIKMGIKVNNRCDSNLDVYEYLLSDDKDLQPSNIQTRSVQKACGYIIYRTKGSNGTFKEDAFIIPLGVKKIK